MDKYWYCGVAVKGVETVYSYISDMGALPVGEYVAVPFGAGNALRIGIVKTCGEYAADNAPYPVNRTKHITRIASVEEYEGQGSLPPFRYYDDTDDEDDLFDDIDFYIDVEDWDEVLEWACEHQDSLNPEVVNKVIECYDHCIAEGYPVAALNLGTMYYNGRGVEQDFQMAYAFYKIAADAGELRAICNCGYCFFYGRHQEVDYGEAYKYFSLGALLHDDANCLYKLGDMYLNGYGVERNEKYAFLLYNRALRRAPADPDILADAQLRVGRCLVRGVGTERDVERGHALLCSALVNFYKRRKTDNYVFGQIQMTKELIAEAQKRLDMETSNYQYPTKETEPGSNKPNMATTSAIELLDDPYCPVFGKEISGGLCIEVSMALCGGGLSIGAIPELATQVWDMETAKRRCNACIYSHVD